MHTITLDCKTLPCPQPIIRLRRLLAKTRPDHITVIVDNEAALENVNRFLTSAGYTVTHTADGDTWRIAADGGQQDTAQNRPGWTAVPEPAARTASRSVPGTLVLLPSPYIGTGDDVLGAGLMKNFLATLPELGESLWRIVLLNGGVRLATHGSPVLDELRALEKNGVSILVCGACLEHFGLLSQLAAGETTNMLDVVTSLQVAEKVLRP